MVKKSKLFVVGLLGASMFFAGCNSKDKMDAKSMFKAASEKLNVA